jgi:hypothetical protein
MNTYFSYVRDVHTQIGPMLDRAARLFGAGKVDEAQELERQAQAIMEAAETIDPSTQKTVAIGWCPGAETCKFIAAKQASPLPPNFAGMHPPPGYRGEVLVDAHKVLLEHDSTWYSERTGIHAEVMILRVWMLELDDTTLTGLNRFNGNSVIVASQPACWCCAKLMTKYGVTYPPEAGTKPLTGWRHPLSNRTVPNSSLPTNQTYVNDTFLENARLYKGAF